MSDALAFMMGEFEATFPADRLYAKNHMWALALDQSNSYRFGFTAYAVRLLQDVYFLDWTVDAGTPLHERQEIGSIESKKAESDLFAPIEGRLVRFNDTALRDPAMINVDKYGEGWLFEISGKGESLLAAQQYVEHLAEVWVVTQRTIKGQLS